MKMSLHVEIMDIVYQWIKDVMGIKIVWMDQMKWNVH